MHDETDLTNDYDGYETVKAEEGGLHSGRKKPHKSSTLWFLAIGVIGMLLVFYLVSLLVP